MTCWRILAELGRCLTLEFLPECENKWGNVVDKGRSTKLITTMPTTRNRPPTPKRTRSSQTYHRSEEEKLVFALGHGACNPRPAPPRPAPQCGVGRGFSQDPRRFGPPHALECTLKGTNPGYQKIKDKGVKNRGVNRTASVDPKIRVSNSTTRESPSTNCTTD